MWAHDYTGRYTDRMKPVDAVAIFFILAGCSGAEKPQATLPAHIEQINLINTPPIGRLSEDQLRGLAARCERYQPSGPARGPYSAKYCDDAEAAWSDSPLHMLVMPPVEK
jgi:hypothetical protein